MRRVLWWGLCVGLFASTQPTLAAPLVEGYLDDASLRINWQVYEATAEDNPQPLENEFTYLYWFEPTGDAASLYSFSLSYQPSVVGDAGPLTTTGVIPGTGPAPQILKPGSWQWGGTFGPPIGTGLAAGERTATLFVHSPSSPGTVLTTKYTVIPTFCFGCEEYNNIPGPLELQAPGDYDGNGTVGGEDFDTWKDQFGRYFPLGQGLYQGMRFRADGNADGSVNAADFTAWRDHYIETPFLAGGVPEPTSAVLLLVGLTTLVWRVLATRRS